MKKNLSIILIAFTLNLFLSSQEFHLDQTKELYIGSTALLLWGTSLLTEGEPGSQQLRNDINSFDYQFMNPYKSNLDKAATLGTCFALISPGVLSFFSGADFSTLGTYGIMYGEAFLLTMGMKDLLKDQISRWRPYSYFESIDNEDDDYFNSFPSGHTAFAFMSASFLSTILLTEYEDNPWSRPLSAAAFTFAGSIGYLRIQSGEHFLTDVIAGSVLGSLMGWLIPFLHNGETEESLPVKPMLNAKGISFQFSF